MDKMNFGVPALTVFGLLGQVIWAWETVVDNEEDVSVREHAIDAIESLLHLILAKVSAKRDKL